MELSFDRVVIVDAGFDYDDDDDDDDVDADVDVYGDGTHPWHRYTYHPIRPSHLHLFLPAELRCFPRELSFPHSRFCLFPSPSLSLPAPRVKLRASQD